MQEFKFKKFSLVSVSTPPPGPVVSADKNGMTPEAWAEKDRLERESIESMSAFRGIIELASSPNFERWDKLNGVLDLALDWATKRLQPQKPTPATKPAKPEALQSKSAIPEADLYTMTFANPGEFYTACNKQFQIPKSTVDGEISGIDLTTEAGRKEAWAIVHSIYGEKPPDEKDGVKETDTAEKQGELESDDLPF